MTRPLIVFVVLWLGWPAAGLADHHNRFVSPSGKVVIERRWKDAGGSILWAVDPAGKEKDVKILDSPRSAWPVFFRDDELLVVNHAIGSGRTECQLYRRNPDRRYAQLMLVSEAAWKFFEKSTGRTTDHLHHQYCYAVAAIDQPQALLLVLSGHGPPRTQTVERWYCLHHLETGEFFLNLEELNRRNEKPAGKGGK